MRVRAGLGRVNAERVFFGDVDVGEVGDDAGERDAGALAQHIQAGIQERGVAAKLVDDECLYQRLLLRLQQRHSAE